MRLLINHLILAILLCLSVNIQAQVNNDQEMQEKIKAARIAMITERLNLTPEQAQKFWPIYNEFSSKKREARRELSQALRGIDRENVSEQEMKELVELRLAVKQQELDLEKQYSSRLLNVISNEQMVRLSQAESDFRQKVLKTIQERKRRRQNLPNKDRPNR